MVDHDRPRSTLVDQGRPRSINADQGRPIGRHRSSRPMSTLVDQGRPRSSKVDLGRPGILAQPFNGKRVVNGINAKRKPNQNCGICNMRDQSLTHTRFLNLSIRFSQICCAYSIDQIPSLSRRLALITLYSNFKFAPLAPYCRPRSTLVDKGRPRPTKADQCRPRSTLVDQGRPRSTNVDHGRPRSTLVDQGRPQTTKVDLGRPMSTTIDQLVDLKVDLKVDRYHILKRY